MKSSTSSPSSGRHPNTIRVLCAMMLFAAATVAHAQVRSTELEDREGVLFRTGSDAPFTGEVEDPGELTGRVENGLRVGEWIWTYPSGRRQRRMLYDEKGQNTVSEGWHENGQRASLWNFKDGAPDGTTRSWDRNGVLREERVWAGGRPNGAYRVWDQNGALLYSCTYQAGVLDGPAVWWYPDGSPRWKTAYEMGERDGTWTQFASDGRIAMRSEWDSGALVSHLEDPHARH